MSRRRDRWLTRLCIFFFFFNDTATTEIYTLSLHDALPIYGQAPELPGPGRFWVAPDAHVIGRVRLGTDVGVWFGAVLRGDGEPLEVGEGSNIQENAMLHTDPGFPLTVGRNVTVGHHAILHGCTVGAGTLIGMGA